MKAAVWDTSAKLQLSALNVLLFNTEEVCFKVKEKTLKDNAVLIDGRSSLADQVVEAVLRGSKVIWHKTGNSGFPHCAQRSLNTRSTAPPNGWAGHAQ